MNIYFANKAQGYFSHLRQYKPTMNTLYMFVLLSILFLLSTEILSTCVSRTSITILNNDAIIAQLYDSAENVWNIDNEVPTSIKVVGPAKWLLMADGERKKISVLLDKYQSEIEPINRLLNNGFISVYRVGLEALDRPIGFGSRLSIPDDALVGHRTYSKVPYNGRLFVSLYYVNQGGWLQVNLRYMHRLYAVALVGEQWGVEVYYTQYFKIQYSSPSTSEFITYSKDGHNVIFYGNNVLNWSIVQKRKFRDPFVSRHIRFLPLSGFKLPISIEYYGCRLFNNDGVYKLGIEPELVPELSDGDLSTFKLVGYRVKYILSFSQSVSSSNVNVSIILNINDCDDTNALILAYVHRYANIFSFDEYLYDGCKPHDVISLQNSNIKHIFECTCRYGLCEHVLFRFSHQQETECLKVTEIELHQ